MSNKTIFFWIAALSFGLFVVMNPMETKYAWYAFLSWYLSWQAYRDELKLEEQNND